MHPSHSPDPARLQRPRYVHVSGVCESQALEEAASCLASGGLVIFPTETVYGLGANALDADAVAAIYTAKGRPGCNPLIVHIAGAPEAILLVRSWPEKARKLAETFWPGPLSLVLEKNERIPDIVTGGGSTIALRSPAHPVALTLIRSAGVPVAAPSANPSGYVSPTSPDHLAPQILKAAAWVIDAGACPGGIESTVLDLTVDPPRILRPGLLSPKDLESVIGPVRAPCGPIQGATPRSPGLLGRHYAPRARVILAQTAREALEIKDRQQARGIRTACVTLGEAHPADSGKLDVAMPLTPGEYARLLYHVLHSLDQSAVECIVVELPPDAPGWEAIRDRLGRAALG